MYNENGVGGNRDLTHGHIVHNVSSVLLDTTPFMGTVTHK